MKKIKIAFFVFIMGMVTVLGQTNDGMVTMNFEDADLRLVVKFVSEVTGENFVVDESVKGTVTVVGPKKIPIEQVRKVLESILMVSGYVLVSSGAVTKIVPIDSARQASPETVALGAAVAEGDHFVTQIIPLRFANAEKLAGMIGSFLTKGGHITFYGPTNSLITADAASNIKRVAQMVNELDRKGIENVPRLYVYHLINADAESVAQVLTQLFEKEEKELEGPGPYQNKDRSFVVADPTTNSLVVHTSKERYSSIKKTIRRLDMKRKQVLVEVLVAEVNLDQEEKLGIEWAAIDGAVYGSQEGFGQDRVNQVSDIANNVLTGGKFPGTSAAYIHDMMQIGTLEIPRLGILVNAFKNNSDINVLATPQILTTDHAEAEILVGQNLAFIKNAQVTPEGSTVRTFEFKDIGLSLRLKPHISSDRRVRMEVLQKVEDVIGQTFEGAVETSKREARTTITVRDSQTAVIGGLIRERKDKVVQKVPILGDIPFLGLPFTRYATQTTKTNLLIFICPHILDTDEQIESVTQKKKEAVPILNGLEEKEAGSKK